MSTLRQNWKKLTSLGKPALAALLIGLFLLLIASSASASVHQRLHAEGQEASHVCVVCLLIQGHIVSADILPEQGPFILNYISLDPFKDTKAKSNSDLRLSPSRAPPRW